MINHLAFRYKYNVSISLKATSKFRSSYILCNIYYIYILKITQWLTHITPRVFIAQTQPSERLRDGSAGSVANQWSRPSKPQGNIRSIGDSMGFMVDSPKSGDRFWSDPSPYRWWFFWGMIWEVIEGMWDLHGDCTWGGNQPYLRILPYITYILGLKGKSEPETIVFSSQILTILALGLQIFPETILNLQWEHVLRRFCSIHSQCRTSPCWGAHCMTGRRRSLSRPMCPAKAWLASEI